MHNNSSPVLILCYPNTFFGAGVNGGCKISRETGINTLFEIELDRVNVRFLLMGYAEPETASLLLTFEVSISIFHPCVLFSFDF